MSVLGKGTTVERAYLIILDTQLLIYFIPYVYLFISFLLLRRVEAPPDAVRVPGGAIGARAIGVSGLIVTLLAMAIAMVPPDGETDPLLFEMKVVGGRARRSWRWGESCTGEDGRDRGSGWWVVSSG